MSIPIPLPGGTYVPLGDIATIERIYKDESKKYITPQTGTGGRYVSLTISKNDGVNIFAVSDTAKKIIVDYVSRPENTILGYVYSMDLADNIRDDYAELAKEAVTTLILVFIAMFIFVGFWDSLFATLTLPLAFLSTFILLNFF
jgi:multidrug efflux pump subunit AcrB